MFGGRGFSILDPADMSRVYDSGDDFERYFTTAEATEAEKAMFNGALGSATVPQSSTFDKRSVDLVQWGEWSIRPSVSQSINQSTNQPTC